jgi:hypothetical protein
VKEKDAAAAEEEMDEMDQDDSLSLSISKRRTKSWTKNLISHSAVVYIQCETKLKLLQISYN